MTPLVILAIRLLVPFAILRWPLWGGLAAIVADFIDIPMLEYFGLGFLDYSYYQPIDKLLDLYYLAFELWVVWGWHDRIARRIAITLFWWRVIGIIAMVATGASWLLLAAPNLFEYFFLYALVRRMFAPQFVIKRTWQLVGPLAVILAFKLWQEYVLHIQHGAFGKVVWKLITSPFR